jgi:hypothetical protein
MIELTRKQPQPFKTLYWCAFVALVPFFVGVINQPGSLRGAGRLLFLPFPIVMVLAGGVLALNVRDNATRLNAIVSEEGLPSFGAVFPRLVGAGVVIVGLVLTTVAALGKG